MRGSIRNGLAVLGSALAMVLCAGVVPAQAQGVAQGSIVSAVPGRTPAILSETGRTSRVFDMEQVGDRIVVSGDFARVQNVSPNGNTIYNRTNVFAFDPVTGAVDPNFDPVLNGVVNAVAAGPGGSVYLGGTFSTVNGTSVRNIVQVNLSNGDRTTAFRPAALNGAVNDLVLSGGKLYVAGVFNTAATIPHGGLVTLDPNTGGVDPYMTVDVSVNHNWTTGSTGARGAVGVSKIDIANGRLVAIGNFKRAEGSLVRDQAMVVLLQAGGTVVDPNWQTTRYAPACASRAYDSYVRDVEFSPDSSYFVIVSTGAHYAGTLCDTAARWDVADQGQAVEPRWIHDTGGDTLFSVAVTGSAVYVGGHERWGNNPLAGDRAGPGAVPRPGIGALDPLNGVPLSWNPGRNPRGVGAEALLATSTGLYVGMDTDWIGNFQYNKKKLAYFPLAGGKGLVSQQTFGLPTVYIAGRDSNNGVLRRTWDGSGTPSADTQLGDRYGGVDWSRARGAFMVGGELFYGYGTTSTNYALVRRTFDGTNLGPATTITAPYIDNEWSTVLNGSAPEGSTYQGMLPNFYGSHLSTVTGMFYWNGKVYYTRSGQTALTARGFSVDSGIIQADSKTVATNSAYSSAKGMFVSGNFLYVVNSANQMTRTSWTNGVPGTTFAVVNNQVNWSARALFLGPAGGQPANRAPTVTLAPPTCNASVCDFSATASDPDGDPVSYAWTFGDGTSGTGAATQQHAYSADGTFTTTVTVSDGRGLTASASRTFQVATTPTGNGIALRSTAQAATPNGGTSVSVTVPRVDPGDGMVLVLSTNSAVTGTAPAGFTAAGVQTVPTSGTNPAAAMTTQVFEGVATGTEDGSRLTVTLSGGAKTTLQLVVYAGTASSGPIRSVAGAGFTGGQTQSTPGATTATAGDWVLSVWSNKATASRTWTAPSDEVVRCNLGAGALTSEVATLVTDGGAPVAASGAVAGKQAGVSAAVAKWTTLTVVLEPAA